MVDRFVDVPKDILELILYETDPKNLDTFCQINERINNLCQDKRILDKYIKYHQLVSNNYESTIQLMIDTNSTILIAYFLEDLTNTDEIFSIYWIIIEQLTNNKNISDQDMFFLLKLIYFKFKNARDRSGVRNNSARYRLEIRNTLTDLALKTNRKQLIQLLKNNNLFDYTQSIHTSIIIGNVEEFMETINYIVKPKLYKKYMVNFFPIQI